MLRNKDFNWANILFLVLTPALSPFVVWYWLKSGAFNYNTVIMSTALYFLFAISITAGYHRLFSHRAYDASWFVKTFFLLVGAGAFQGSALTWSLDHRVHHKYVDDPEKDPYAITKGFWFAHFFWLFYKRAENPNDSKNGPDLFGDPLVMFQHKFFVPIASLFCFGLPALIASFWGDALGGFFIGGILRVTLNHHGTFLINSACHMIGDRTYSEDHSARDSWITAILTCGEGYHNYHHEYPSDYRNGIRWYDFDPTKWLIHGFYRLGLASNLKRVSYDRVLLKKMKLQEAKLKAKLANQPRTIIEMANGYVNKMHEAFEPLITRCTEIHNDMKKVADKKEHKLLKVELKATYKECKQVSRMWDEMLAQINQKLVTAHA